MTLTYTDGGPVQIGDTVTVEGVVENVGTDWEGALVKVAQRTFWISPRDIASHSPAHIKAGDKVLWGAHSTLYEVIAIHDGKAWISPRKGVNFIVCLSQLRKAPPK